MAGYAGMYDEASGHLTMVGPTGDKTRVAYERLMGEKSEEMAGGMCWPVDWFPEKLPIENMTGNATGFYLQNMADPFATLGQAWPPIQRDVVSTEDVLIFSDSYGYCKEILEQAPPGRLDKINHQQRPLAKYNEKDVKNLVKIHNWDLILFAIGIDPPPSNDDIEEYHKYQFDVAMVLLTILKTIAEDPSRCKRLAILTADAFAEEKEIHEECGIGLICNCTLFGMANTGRMEVQCPIQYIDTEWALRTENTKYIVAELFRHQSFGHNTVRILNRGRYVLRGMPSAQYENGSDLEMPQEGVIGISGGNGALGLVMGLWLLNKAKEQGGKKFSIQFLSRSCKINDQNMPNWKEVQRLGEELGIGVSQEVCDVGSQASVEEYIKANSPNIVGIIHSAGVLRDSMLFNQTPDKFDEVYQSKSRAAMFIHVALEKYENPDLQFFWLFSSGAVYGNMGQLNYSSSNSWLDGIARHRRALGKPCMAPQWGAWGEVGMAVNLDDASRRRMANSPMPYFSNAEGLYGLECGIRTRMPHFQVHKTNPPLFFGMIMGDDAPSQCYVRNFQSVIAPPPPGDPYKNFYTTIAYETRKENHYLANGLMFNHLWGDIAYAMRYYRD